MAIIVPFPTIRRRAFIERQAHRASCLSPESGEKHIRRQLDIQSETMARKGIHAAQIEHERITLEAAIRAELVRARLFPTGAA
ncbi:MAG: hypothetical protein JWM36_3211 [Hyphomicrobiales bacterium]|nr:hypothetical protein [Hyphomicrobiales bacterium]